MKDYQNTLFPYAYNILGSIEDSKDAIQEILIKYHSRQNDHIENDMGYLVKAVINESINIKKKRQRMYGDSIWLPEPVATEVADGSVDSSEIISYSLLVLLEKLSTKERAVFILKEAFEYSHKEIAEVLGLTIENSRKLLSRAKSKLDNSTDTVSTNTPMVSKEYMGKYINSIRSGDIKTLEKMLSEEITLMADGGNEIKVVRELTQGLKNAIKLLLFVFKTYQKEQTIEVSQINHQPALLFFEEGVLVNCQVFQVSENKIVQIHTQLAPKKLKPLAAQLS
ncbi:sigma-70 family RNA polymerase sigma factor [Flagellimonas nanhaiensis]|uniref:RNA polymerase subunit sigma-24 n=1 Tax=Flagellimonas nanhaiensis TaxID=2292706 RepID=A0A371JL05_9FLAO|nr:sigma-70 family RNA polymerase sigma factor [Allomuricauda nanhaiensis]RDY57647.1 RNA polymerase subunit sigma-24 [Allomuricauda nanhaiensis]